MTEAPEATEKPTVIARVATVLLVLFSAWMWVETLSILAYLAPPPPELSGAPSTAGRVFATLAGGFRSYWWLAVPVVLLAAGWMIQSGLRRDRFRRAAIVAAVSFGVAGIAGGIAFVVVMAPLIALMRAMS